MILIAPDFHAAKLRLNDCQLRHYLKIALCFDSYVSAGLLRASALCDVRDDIFYPLLVGDLHFGMVGTGPIAGWIEALGRDLRHAARGLCKAPAFTLVAVLTLALGIGGTTTIFSAIDALLLRPPPYPEQDRLVALSTTYAKFPRDRGPVSATDVAHWRADNRVFEQIECASWPDMVATSSPGYAERVGVQHVSVRLISLLGVKTFLGTLPTDPVSEKRGSDGVAISYEFWQHHFRG